MKRKITFVHTSPAAIPPLMQFYGASAPELEITNLLDDGILRFFSLGDFTAAERRLSDLLFAARSTYGAELVMITCSAVPRDLMTRLCGASAVPLIKIDDPMAQLAVRGGGKVGVAVTFPPTLEPTTRLLKEAAADARVEVELISSVMPDAYQALLSGDPARHDELLIAGVNRLVSQEVSVIVLAQVSMARILPQLKGSISIPVFSSLHTSLDAIRRILPSVQ